MCLYALSLSFPSFPHSLSLSLSVNSLTFSVSVPSFPFLYSVPPCAVLRTEMVNFDWSRSPSTARTSSVAMVGVRSLSSSVSLLLSHFMVLSFRSFFSLSSLSLSLYHPRVVCMRCTCGNRSSRPGPDPDLLYHSLSSRFLSTFPLSLSGRTRPGPLEARMCRESNTHHTQQTSIATLAA